MKHSKCCWNESAGLTALNWHWGTDEFYGSILQLSRLLDNVQKRTNPAFCTGKWGLVSAVRCSRVDVIKIIFLKWLVIPELLEEEVPWAAGDGLDLWGKTPWEQWGSAEVGAAGVTAILMWVWARQEKWSGGTVALETKDWNWLFFLQNLLTGSRIRGEMQMWSSSVVCWAAARSLLCGNQELSASPIHWIISLISAG